MTTHPKTQSNKRNLVVVGGSAGSVPVLLELAQRLPKTLPASVLVVLHIGAHRSQLPALLTARGGMPAVHPASGQQLVDGVIYVAPPDRHMLVLGEHIQLSHGAKEHHARPAIDPLFRSAALAAGPRTVGVVLSGRLDDGTAGLQAIKQRGGFTVIQDPDDAQEASMPVSARRYVEIDHVAPSRDLADAIVAAVATPAPAETPVPDLLRHEQRLFMREGNSMEHLDAIGTRSELTCPDCSGVLWRLHASAPPQYRCHTGHAYTLRSLEYAQREQTDQVMWNAFRSLQERERLLDEMIAVLRGSDGDESTRYASLANNAADRSERMRRLLEEQDPPS